MISDRFSTTGPTFMHNGDYSGDVEIASGRTRVTVPFVDILALVADYMGSEMTREIEGGDFHTIAHMFAATRRPRTTGIMPRLSLDPE